MIGKIERVPLRDVWKHEAYDFTQWLEDNIDVLNDVLDLTLSNPEREQSTVSFNVDLLAEDEAGNPVIIENQLEKSNHDHLGKVLTYLVAFSAKTAIWIVSNPRPEHVNVISWLNESSSANFYLLKVEAIKIGGSEPAPLLTLIVGPSEEGKEVGRAKRELADRDLVRYKFWKHLLEASKKKTKLHTNISPNHYHWLGASAGKRGLGYNYTLRQKEAIVELYIDRGKEADEENKQIFDQLQEHRQDIENTFDSQLSWQRLDGKRACRICTIIKNDGWKNEDKWTELHEEMINNMIQLEKALKPFIAKLNI